VRKVESTNLVHETSLRYSVVTREQYQSRSGHAQVAVALARHVPESYGQGAQSSSKVVGEYPMSRQRVAPRIQ
jgi:hypothetical protein